MSTAAFCLCLRVARRRSSPTRDEDLIHPFPPHRPTRSKVFPHAFQAATQAHAEKRTESILAPRASLKLTHMTQQHALPQLTKDLVDAFAASATLWLARLMSLLFNPRATARKRLFLRLVQAGERCVEHVLF